MNIADRLLGNLLDITERLSKMQHVPMHRYDGTKIKLPEDFFLKAEKFQNELVMFTHELEKALGYSQVVRYEPEPETRRMTLHPELPTHPRDAAIQELIDGLKPAGA